MILVLTVLSTMTAIILPIGDKWIQKNSEEDALQALIVSIYSLQAYSMANYVVTRLEFKNGGTEYITSDLAGNEFGRNVFPQGMRVASSSYLKGVEFHANGNIIRSGSIALLTTSGIIEIRLQFQHGRMIIYE